MGFFDALEIDKKQGPYSIDTLFEDVFDMKRVAVIDTLDPFPVRDNEHEFKQRKRTNYR